MTWFGWPAVTKLWSNHFPKENFPDQRFTNTLKLSHTSPLWHMSLWLFLYLCVKPRMSFCFPYLIVNSVILRNLFLFTATSAACSMCQQTEKTKWMKERNETNLCKRIQWKQKEIEVEKKSADVIVKWSGPWKRYEAIEAKALRPK